MTLPGYFCEPIIDNTHPNITSLLCLPKLGGAGCGPCFSEKPRGEAVTCSSLFTNVQSHMWFISCANLTGPQGTQMFGEMVFLGCVRVLRV